MDDLRPAILSAGVEAVKVYIETSDCIYDNELPERFLTSLMAVHLHKALAVNAKVERPYETIADELRIELSPQARNQIKQRSADIALYEGKKLRAVIEAKKFAEGADVGRIHFDLHKGDPCSLSAHAEVLLAVMVCEIAGISLDRRKKELERAAALEATRVEWVYSKPPVRARDDQWEWCFACGSLKCA